MPPPNFVKIPPPKKKEKIIMIFWAQNNNDIVFVNLCYFLAKIQCYRWRFFEKNRKKRLRQQSNFHIFRHFQYKYTFNNEPKNAKKWIVTVKYRQKTKNYLNMTNIDKKLKLTSKVRYNINQKSEIWSKINTIYGSNFGLWGSLLGLLKLILCLWDSILFICESLFGS